MESLIEGLRQPGRQARVLARLGPAGTSGPPRRDRAVLSEQSGIAPSRLESSSQRECFGASRMCERSRVRRRLQYPSAMHGRELLGLLSPWLSKHEGNRNQRHRCVDHRLNMCCIGAYANYPFAVNK